MKFERAMELLNEIVNTKVEEAGLDVQEAAEELLGMASPWTNSSRTSTLTPKTSKTSLLRMTTMMRMTNIQGSSGFTVDV